MATTFYLTSGLGAIDYGDIAAIGSNTFYITAGLPADDSPVDTGRKRQTGLLLGVY